MRDHVRLQVLCLTCYEDAKYYHTRILSLVDMALENALVIHKAEFSLRLLQKRVPAHAEFMSTKQESLLGLGSTDLREVLPVET